MPLVVLWASFLRSQIKKAMKIRKLLELTGKVELYRSCLREYEARLREIAENGKKRTEKAKMMEDEKDVFRARAISLLEVLQHDRRLLPWL
jgi:hypothetical protein